jgi:hypothetical protein
MANARFPSPLIEPDVRMSHIRLSDWLHREAHGENGSRAASAGHVSLLRLTTQQSRMAVIAWCLQAANHHDLAVFESAPEVRVGG